MTYTVSSGTLNSTIPYHTIGTSYMRAHSKRNHKQIYHGGHTRYDLFVVANLRVCIGN